VQEIDWLFKFSTNHIEALPGCTVHFDWLKVESVPKKLDAAQF
jgi:hypothetical protein